MQIILHNTYIDREARLAELDKELAVVEERLKTPARTLDDFIRHMEILKERNNLLPA